MLTTEIIFLGTNAANLADNKEIGLRFLTAVPATGSEISIDSMISDQLKVAHRLLSMFGSLDSYESVTPWMVIPEWTFQLEGHPTSEVHEQFRQASAQIGSDIEMVGDLIWDQNDAKADQLRCRLLKQMEECINLIEKKLITVKLCMQLAELGLNPSHGEFTRVLNAGNAQAVAELLDAISGYSPGMFVAMAYLRAKNDCHIQRDFAIVLLYHVKGFLIPKAIEQGYKE